MSKPKSLKQERKDIDKHYNYIINNPNISQNDKITANILMSILIIAEFINNPNISQNDKITANILMSILIIAESLTKELRRSIK